MSWSQIAPTSPISDASGLNQNLTVLSVTPWTHGINEGAGEHTVLSFPNAVDALINNLPTQPSGAVFAIAVYAANANDLASQINTLTSVLPIKQLLQWQRHATKLINLEKNKFDLVGQVPDVNSMAINAIPEVKTRMKKAISQAALTEAAALVGEDPLTNLNAFEVNKTAHNTDVNTALPALAGGAGLRFYSEVDIAADLKVNSLGHEYTMTAILAFIGSAAELAYLKEMMP